MSSKKSRVRLPCRLRSAGPRVLLLVEVLLLGISHHHDGNDRVCEQRNNRGVVLSAGSLFKTSGPSPCSKSTTTSYSAFLNKCLLQFRQASAAPPVLRPLKKRSTAHTISVGPQRPQVRMYGGGKRRGGAVLSSFIKLKKTKEFEKDGLADVQLFADLTRRPAHHPQPRLLSRARARCIVSDDRAVRSSRPSNQYRVFYLLLSSRWRGRCLAVWTMPARGGGWRAGTSRAISWRRWGSGWRLRRARWRERGSRWRSWRAGSRLRRGR